MSEKFHIISTHNSKLSRDGIISINLPAGITCPGAGKCRDYCYAQVGQQAIGSAKQRRLDNLKLWKSNPKGFESIVKFEVQKSNRRIVRWMDSGDIPTLAFLRMMVRVGKQIPEVCFYAYTKSIAIVLRFGWSKLPENLKLIQSYGGKNDHLIDESRPFARIFPRAEDIPPDYTNASLSDYLPATTAHKIGIVAHGARKRRFTVTQTME